MFESNNKKNIKKIQLKIFSFFQVKNIYILHRYVFVMTSVHCSIIVEQHWIFSSIFQIYNEYVQASDSLEVEKAENQRLNTYLDQILQVGHFLLLLSIEKLLATQIT